ncbi:peroxisomal assembly protein [Ranunculus cassubicifolius]
MVERRKPLILNSTKNLVNSVLKPISKTKSRDHEEDLNDSPCLRLAAGILRCANKNSESEEGSFDDATLVGVSKSVLRQLSITSGSLVLVRNIGTMLQRVGRVAVLDRPDTVPNDISLLSPHSPHAMVSFPSYRFQSNHDLPSDDVAFLSPLLAFNLELHISCLKSLVHDGQESLMSLFEERKSMEDDKENKASFVEIELKPWTSLPSYASHLRVSFVKIPECGTFESLRGRSSVETEDRQGLVDLALHDYFEVDRYLARGDIFCIHISWNCSSQMCIPCSQTTKENDMSSTVYFKVMGMEPVDEPVLRVNCSKTALVLGGTVPSGVPPDLLISDSKEFAPLHGDTVKILASILAPPLCPSSLSSKFRVAVLLHGLAGCGKRTVVRYVARRLGLHVVEYSCYDLMSSSEKKVSEALAHAFSAAQRYSPTILLLRHFEVFKKVSTHEGSPSDQVGLTTEVASVLRELTQPDSDFEVSSSDEQDALRISGHQVLLVAVADSSEGLPAPIRRCFSHEVSMGSLNEDQRGEMFSQLLQTISDVPKDNGTVDLVKDVVAQSAGFMPRDVSALVADAGANLISKLTTDETRESDENSSFKIIHDNIPSKPAHRYLGKEDIIRALERSKKRNASALGTPKVPNVKWEDVGGLEDVKKAILDTVQLPLLHKDLFSSGLRKRSGVLLYGPPGTGKTLLAKAVATECSLNFLSVKGPELINMYIGESEKNVRDIFQKARSACPCVIFFDELDSLAPARGASGDSGGVMDRVVSQMLAEIDGLNDTTQDLFIIGASNRPDLIDPALLRPGRFDKLLYVGVNSDTSYRERVLEALTRKIKLHENVTLYAIAKRCPLNFTGADMYALCADAWFYAAKRKVLGLRSDSSNIDDEPDSVVVEFDDFVKVLGELSPSLSVAELTKYEKLRDQFEGVTAK